MELETLLLVIILVYWLGYRVPVIIYKKAQTHLVKKKRLAFLGELPLLISLVFYGYLVYVLAANLSKTNRIPLAIALVLFIFSAVFNEWSRIVLGKQWSGATRILKKHRLIKKGTYSLVRHPMYFANILMMLSGLIVFRSLLMVFLFITNFFILLYRSKIEEEELLKIFKKEYRFYQKSVKRLIPYIY